jgi:hypothetical protein
MGRSEDVAYETSQRDYRLPSYLKSMFDEKHRNQRARSIGQSGTALMNYAGADGIERSTRNTYDTIPDEVEISVPGDHAPQVEPEIMSPIVRAPSYHITLSLR